VLTCHRLLVGGHGQLNTGIEVVGSGPHDVNELFILPPSSFPLHLVLQFTQPLTEMIIGNREIIFLGSTVRPARKADNPTVICEPIV
jgi:hypothetical protein